MRKLFFVYFLILALVASSFAYIWMYGKQTAPKKESITYVSLGDSIAEGYALDTYDDKDSNEFVVGSYAHSFKTALEKEYKTVNAANYATKGDTSTDLLTMLTELSGTELSTENQQMKTNIQNADIITICIGANDILGPAKSNILSFMTKEDFDITPYVNPGLENFNTNFPKIITALKTLNPTANLVFFNTYNPYKEFITTSADISVSSYPGPITISSSKLNQLGSLTELYLNSEDVIYNGAPGINKIISNGLTGQQNCYLLDIKLCFDTYYTSQNNYDIVNVNVLTNPSLTPLNVITAMDPHPSNIGHTQIFNLLNTWYETSFK